jgi:hypothetical protein
MPYCRFVKLSLVKKKRLCRISGKLDHRIGMRRECRLDEFEVDDKELRARGKRSDISND